MTTDPTMKDERVLCDQYAELTPSIEFGNI